MITYERRNRDCSLSTEARERKPSSRAAARRSTEAAALSETRLAFPTQARLNSEQQQRDNLCGGEFRGFYG